MFGFGGKKKVVVPGYTKGNGERVSGYTYERDAKAGKVPSARPTPPKRGKVTQSHMTPSAGQGVVTNSRLTPGVVSDWDWDEGAATREWREAAADWDGKPVTEAHVTPSAWQGPVTQSAVRDSVRSPLESHRPHNPSSQTSTAVHRSLKAYPELFSLPDRRLPGELNFGGVRPPVKRGASLRGGWFFRSESPGKDFAGEDCTETNFSLSNLAGCSAVGVSFAKSEVEGSTWDGSDLSNTSFVRAKASWCGFRKVRLNGADMRGGDFTGSDFTGSPMDGVDVRGAVFEGAKGLRDENLRGCLWDKTTVWPEGFRPRFEPPQPSYEGIEY